MKLPSIKELSALIRGLKPKRHDESRAYEDVNVPSILLTVGCDTKTGEWGWQTGDNSYMGGAYGFPTWGTIAIYRHSSSRELARAIRDEIARISHEQERARELEALCIYHGNCADGFAAAWIVRKARGEIDFHPASYQQPPPDVTGKDVVIVDFSYKRPVLLQMAEKANSILILDHHKSAAEDLSAQMPENVTAKFDMNHSGAMLAWEHFFPGQEPPPLLLHIEDRDLWRFALPNTRQIQANLFSFPYDFQVWDMLMATAPSVLAVEGEAIERKHFKDIRELLGVTTRDMMIGGYRVPVANLPYTMSSDAGHELAKGRPFAACYWDTPNGRVFSLRSSNDGVDVAEVAKQYGGGGHRNAAGFRVSFAQAQAFEEQNSEQNS